MFNKSSHAITSNLTSLYSLYSVDSSTLSTRMTTLLPGSFTRLSRLNHDFSFIVGLIHAPFLMSRTGEDSSSFLSDCVSYSKWQQCMSTVLTKKRLSQSHAVVNTERLQTIIITIMICQLPYSVWLPHDAIGVCVCLRIYLGCFLGCFLGTFVQTSCESTMSRHKTSCISSCLLSPFSSSSLEFVLSCTSCYCWSSLVKRFLSWLKNIKALVLILLKLGLFSEASSLPAFPLQGILFILFFRLFLLLLFVSHSLFTFHCMMILLLLISRPLMSVKRSLWWKIPGTILK